MHKRNAWWIAWTLTALLLPRLAAQDLRVNLSGTPDPAVANSPVLFQLSLTNRTTSNISNVLINAVFTGPAQFMTATNQFGFVTNQGNVILFGFETLTNRTQLSVTYRLNPTSFGEINHSVLVESSNSDAFETNFVTRIVAGSAALGVSFRALPTGALSGDFLAYQALATNRGPDTAPGVQLTHTLPSGLTFVGLDPPGQSFVHSGNQVVVALGVMTNGAGRLLQFRAQPTASGALPLVAVITAPGFENPSTNGQAQATLTIATPGPGQLTAAAIGPQVFNRQNGLMEQRVRVTNVGNVASTASRVMVAGLTNWLYNAAGTNRTTPFVVVPQPLNSGATVELLLQYFNPSRLPGGNPQLTALDVPIPGPWRPNGVVVPSALSWLTDGTVALDFTSQPGRRYAVLYGPDARLANGAALPALFPPANRTRWVDYGPPLTAPGPLQAPMRIYQVIEVTDP